MPDEARAPLLSRDRIDETDNRSDHGSGDATTDYGSVYRYPLYLQPGQFTSLEKLMFFVSSILLILLCIFIGLYARSSFGDHLTPPPSTPTSIPNPLPPPEQNETYCMEPHCILTAARILQDVNPSIDPCDDFYAYTCSNWAADHALPEDKPKLTISTIADEQIKQQLQQILVHSVDDTIPKNDAMLLPPPDRILDRQLFTKLQDFYQACMDVDRIESRGITPLYDMFRTIRSYLPLGYYYDANDNRPGFVEGLSQAVSFLGQHDIWALFEMDVGPDPQDPSRRSVSIRQGQVGLPSREYYDDPEVLGTYMRVVTEILETVFSKDDRNEFGWNSWSAIATARRIVEFEKELTLQPEVLNHHHYSSSSSIQRWTVDELQRTAPNINWGLVLKSVVPRGVPNPQLLLVPRPEFVTSLSEQVLGKTNVRTLQMYLIWRTIWKYLDTLGEEFIAPRRKLDAQLSGIEARAKPPRWQTCLAHIDQSLGYLLGRYYVLSLDNLFEQRAKEYITSIVDEFLERVGSLSWIDGDTRKVITEKAANMKILLGYPTSNPDIRSPISLSEYYNDVMVNKSGFFETMLSASQWRAKARWTSLKVPVNRDIWDIPPQHVGLFFDKKLNKLQIPAANLKLPFFQAAGPEYLGYGSLGALITHEILHGFDRQGRQYDSQGNLGSWWTNDSISKFDALGTCFADQYSRFTVRGPDGQLHPVDGERTLDSNIADSGALMQAFDAWQKRFISNKNRFHNNDRLPGLDRWTREQLFYINFARMRCSKSTLANDMHELLTQDHAPDRWRVNGPLMNSEHFAQAFTCKKGSPMNPPEKCHLW